MAGMDFIKGLGNTISSASRDGLNKAKEIKDSAKISFDIRERENAIRRMYRDLGKVYYQDHKEDISSEYRDRIMAISAAFEEIGELKADLDEVRGIRRCPACGKVIPPEAKFCAECGEKCEEEVVDCKVVDDEEDAAGNESAATADCTGGSESEDSAESTGGSESDEAADCTGGSESEDSADCTGGSESEDSADCTGGSESEDSAESTGENESEWAAKSAGGTVANGEDGDPTGDADAAEGE